MADIRNQLRGLVLSAQELKQLNGWDDAMVEDYLNILDNLILLADGIDQTDVDLSGIEARLADLEALVPIAVYLTADRDVTASNEIIICENTVPVTITLPLDPLQNQKIVIKRSGSKVTIDGNGKLIDGNSSVVMNQKYVGLDLVFSAGADFWSIV